MSNKKTERQIISGGYHRPVCVICKVELRCHKNGVGVLDIVEGKPYELYASDIWKCPDCGIEIAGGFGLGSIGNWDENFKKSIQSHREHGTLIENNC